MPRIGENSAASLEHNINNATGQAKGSPMRRLVFCFDGSWNGLKADNRPTNVQLVAEDIKPIDADDGTVQIVYYDEGVGTRSDEVLRGGALGEGLLENLREAYRFLIFNYSAGDEIYCFGFSRGGFTAMAFAGLIRSIGILPTSSANEIDRGIKLYRESAVSAGVDSERLCDFRAQYCPQYCVSVDEIAWRIANIPGWTEEGSSVIEIRYLGVWDAVGSIGLGVVKALFSKDTEQFYERYFTDIDAIVTSARHAVSLDERRRVFKPTLWKNLQKLNRGAMPQRFDDLRPYQQKWFPGDHGSVGGGGEYDGLSKAALQWIIEGAALEKLAFNVVGSSRLSKIRYDINTPLQNTHLSWWGEAKSFVKSIIISSDRGGPSDLHEVSWAAQRLWSYNPNYRPRVLKILEKDLNQESVRFVPLEIPVEVGFESYCVLEGDDLTKIAKKFYDDSSLRDLIYRVNADMLDSPSYISPGETLKVPNRPFQFD